MKSEKLFLAASGAFACAWAAWMLLGVADMARHPDVPVPAALLDLPMFLGAGLLPLLAAWVFKKPTNT